MPDCPGFGHSDWPDPKQFDYTFDHIASVMNDFTQALALSHYTVYMRDYGGPVGFRMALAHSERVEALIVQDAVAHNEGLGANWATRRAFWADRPAYEEALRKNLLSLATTKTRHIGDDPHVELYDPDLWTDEYVGGTIGPFCQSPLATTKVSKRSNSSMKRRKKIKILMVLTSHDQLATLAARPASGLRNCGPLLCVQGCWCQPDAGLTERRAALIDPKSDLPENQTPAMARFKRDQGAQEALAHTVRLADMKAEDFDTVFYVGGHGPMWDLVDNPDSIALIESFYNSGKPVAAVCHSPAVLHRVTYKGAPIVKDKRVTGFTNGEDEAVHLTRVVPFLVEDELKRVGARYEKAADWESFAIVDGHLITGQNPASSSAAANALLKVVAPKGAYA